jgi:AbrB family looped-hinge helix DNA binding protein
MAQMATVSSKGQIVIPAALRKKFRIKKGTRLAVPIPMTLFGLFEDP